MEREFSGIVGGIATGEVRTVDDLNSSGMASLITECLGREQMPWSWIQVVTSNSFGLSSEIIHLKVGKEIGNRTK